MLGDSPGVLSVLEKSAHHSRSKENLQARHSASFFPYKGYCASALAGLPPCCRRERLFSPLFPLPSLLVTLTGHCSPGRASGGVGVAKGCFLEGSLEPAPWPKLGKKTGARPGWAQSTGKSISVIITVGPSVCHSRRKHLRMQALACNFSCRP